MNIYYMKWLKLFEAFTTEDYYRKVTREEYDSHAGSSGVRFGINYQHLNDKEKEKITEILRTKDLVEQTESNISLYNNYQFDYKTTGGFHGLKIVKGDSGPGSKGRIEYYINKVKDDWYLVAEYTYSNFQGSNYLCDQLEGLLQFLKNKI